MGTYDTPASPLWSFGGGPAPPASLPNPVWQCFHIGTRIKFLLANTDAPWQKAEELAWKDHVAMKIDARNSYQYAPNGLVLVQVRYDIFFCKVACYVKKYFFQKYYTVGQKI